MIQIPWVIDQALTHGLRPHSVYGADAPYLSTCYGLIPRPQGLISPPSIVNVTAPQPYNQLFHHKKPYMLYGDNGNGVLASLNTDLTVDNDGLLDGMKDIFTDLSATMAYNGGGQQVALFEGFTLILDSQAFYSLSPVGVYKARFSDSLGVASVCNFYGRPVYGGLTQNGGWAQSTEFHALLKLCAKYSNDDPEYEGNLGLDTGANLFFGMPHGGSHNKPHLIDLCFLTGYGYSSLKSIVEDAIRTRAISYLHLREGGPVIGLHALSGRLIALGNSTCWNLQQTERGTFIQKVFSEVGLHSRPMYTGDDEELCWVTANGLAYRLQSNFVEQELGYSEYLYPMLTSSPQMTFDGVNREFYITVPSTKAYVISNRGRGFAEARNRPNSLITHLGQLTGITTSNTTTPFTFAHQFVDLGRRAHKTVDTVQIHMSGTGKVGVKVYARNAIAGNYISGPTRVFSPIGVAYPVTTGIDLLLAVDGEDTGDISINSLQVLYKQSDLRPIRGLIGSKKTGAVNGTDEQPQE